MKNTFGSAVSITIFGESHGCAVGAILDGLTPGIPVDEEFIAHRMNKRRSVASVSTASRESDEVKILSGGINGKTKPTGKEEADSKQNRADNQTNKLELPVSFLFRLPSPSLLLFLLFLLLLLHLLLSSQQNYPRMVAAVKDTSVLIRL